MIFLKKLGEDQNETTWCNITLDFFFIFSGDGIYEHAVAIIDLVYL